jgi:hypothetical protein
MQSGWCKDRRKVCPIWKTAFNERVRNRQLSFQQDEEVLPFALG